MKGRILVLTVTIFVAIGLVLVFAGVVTAQGRMVEGINNSQTNGAALTVHLNLGPDDPEIDPGLGTSDAAFAVIDQLFLGLVRVDEESGEVLPELATSWVASTNATQFTFTLRDDVFWTDGTPFTANDVRYGILRNLEPDTDAPRAYILYVIQNARDYHEGSITDPNLVGITVLDNTHIRFDLEHSAAYFPSILDRAVARPLPEWAITAHPESWTEPANIVTNGPYRLTVWAHGSSIVLDKNPTFFGIESVQIELVDFRMVDEAAGWVMFQNGLLDSAQVPVDLWSSAKSDPLLSQELRSAPRLCTYYYGFNTAKAPFDDPLVRKAFIAAVDRQGVIDEATGYAQQPALTFTPPGVFGHVDGYAAGVGIPYNQTQAQGYLAAAGYPGGAGLPPITLMYNTSTGHQAIAEAVQQDWLNTLGVSVALADMEWNAYLDLLSTDPPQIWRLGWCPDYVDAYNFLYDGVIPGNVRFGGWSNPTYGSLLEAVAMTLDLGARAVLYQQAEEILVETDAVMLPIYYYNNGFATKPYLERTYGAGGLGGWIADWKITRVSETIGTGGGSLISYAGDTTINIPAGAFTGTVVLSHSPSYGIPPGGNLAGFGRIFDLTAVYTDTGQPALPTSSFNLQVSYSEDELGGIPEDTLALYYWVEDGWAQEPSSMVDPVNNYVAATPDHLSKWAVFGEVERIFLPLTMR